MNNSNKIVGDEKTNKLSMSIVEDTIKAPKIGQIEQKTDI